jgi:hypothetical protein
VIRHEVAKGNLNPNTTKANRISENYTILKCSL